MLQLKLAVLPLTSHLLPRTSYLVYLKLAGIT
jgi:hypothetical protein